MKFSKIFKFNKSGKKWAKNKKIAMEVDNEENLSQITVSSCWKQEDTVELLQNTGDEFNTNYNNASNDRLENHSGVTSDGDKRATGNSDGVRNDIRRATGNSEVVNMDKEDTALMRTHLNTGISTKRKQVTIYIIIELMGMCVCPPGPSVVSISIV